MVGTVNEDFAVESMAGDIFQLGNTSYRILRVEPAACASRTRRARRRPFRSGSARRRGAATSCRRRVAAARGDVRAAAMPAACRRARGVAARAARPRRSRRAAARRLSRPREGRARRAADASTRSCWSASSTSPAACSWSSTRRSAAASTAPGAWRCASASAASSTSSCRPPRPRTRSCCRCRPATAFRWSEVARYLHSNTAAHVLMQALLDAPMFGVRWRWNATTALALPRFIGGKKVPPQLQRMKRRGPARRGVPRSGRLPGEPRRRARGSGPSAGRRRRCTTACTRRWTSTGWLALLRAHRSAARSPSSRAT